MSKIQNEPNFRNSVYMRLSALTDLTPMASEKAELRALRKRNFPPIPHFSPAFRAASARLIENRRKKRFERILASARDVGTSRCATATEKV